MLKFITRKIGGYPTVFLCGFVNLALCFFNWTVVVDTHRVAVRQKNPCKPIGGVFVFHGAILTHV